MNFAFYISGKATRFNKLINDNNEKLLKLVKFVFSDSEENLYLIEKLNQLNIKYILLDYKKMEYEKSQKNFELSNCLLSYLRKFKVDYCFSFGGHILKGEILSEYKNRIINFHPSILPAYPGLRAIDQAIAEKANILGNTAHFIDEGIDTGPIIMQSIISVVAFQERGYDAVLDMQIEMLYKIVNLLIEDRIYVVNNSVKIEGANYNFHYILPYVDTDIT